jgi:hypothetical protein
MFSFITCNKNGPERIMHQLFYGLSCSSLVVVVIIVVDYFTTMKKRPGTSVQ